MEKMRIRILQQMQDKRITTAEAVDRLKCLLELWTPR